MVFAVRNGRAGCAESERSPAGYAPAVAIERRALWNYRPTTPLTDGRTDAQHMLFDALADDPKSDISQSNARTSGGRLIRG
jgi:hypothetical protein